jgi:hypothetical protein
MFLLYLLDVYASEKKKMKVKILLVLLVFSISCVNKIEDKNNNNVHSEEDAIAVVDTFLYHLYENKYDLYFQGEDVDSIEGFSNSEIVSIENNIIERKKKIINAENVSLKNKYYSKLFILHNELKFHKTFVGYFIIKNFFVRDFEGPMIRQAFYVDTTLMLRAASVPWRTKIIIDTIDGELNYSYVDTAANIGWVEYWN